MTTCTICRAVVETVAENELENWLRHHVRQMQAGSTAHWVATGIMAVLMAWAGPKVSQAFRGWR
jgi:hypothetical protein